MMKYVKKYSIAIICALFLLFMGKSCQSCSRGRQLEYNKIEYSHDIDSLQKVITSKDKQLVLAEDSIKLLNAELKSLREINGFVTTSLEHSRQTNKTLTNQLKNK